MGRRKKPDPVALEVLHAAQVYQAIHETTNRMATVMRGTVRLADTEIPDDEIQQLMLAARDTATVLMKQLAQAQHKAAVRLCTRI